MSSPEAGEGSGWIVRPASWETDGEGLSAVRTEVFVEGQGVAVEIERDGNDPHCRHAIALAGDGTPVGAARMSADGRIGRMAVLAPWRRRGIGGAMLECLLAEADRRGMDETRLHAQSHAEPFYARFGFEPEGEPFEEAGIAHVAMVRRG